MKTTLNIHIDTMAKISKAAAGNDATCSEMIHLLIQKVAGNIADPGRIGKMVQYQSRCSPDEWHTFHIQLREDAYEYWLDLRKLLKMSVSLILAYAVKKFLNKLLQKNNTSDNYPLKNYIIAKEMIDDVIIWKLIWGYPPNPEKIINF